MNVMNSAIDDVNVQVHYSKFLFCVRNILTNAIKFSNHDAEIWVDFNQNILSIQDFGKGMTKEQKNALEKGENKISLSGTNDEKGSGIGMRLVYQFAKAQNIDLKIETEINKGTVVKFLLNNF